VAKLCSRRPTGTDDVVTGSEGACSQSGVGQSNAMKLRVWLPFCDSNKKVRAVSLRAHRIAFGVLRLSIR